MKLQLRKTKGRQDDENDSEKFLWEKFTQNSLVLKASSHNLSNIKDENKVNFFPWLGSSSFLINTTFPVVSSSLSPTHFSSSIILIGTQDDYLDSSVLFLYFNLSVLLKNRALNLIMVPGLGHLSSNYS